MMRIPLPAVLAALVAVAAGSVLLNVHVKSDVFVINATALAPGQNMTITLDYIPTRIRIIGRNDMYYEIHIYANATFAERASELLPHIFVTEGIYVNYVGSGVVIEVKVVDVRDPRAKIVVYAWRA
jgi:hypothetical protein